jgi:hypothetical protein
MTPFLALTPTVIPNRLAGDCPPEVGLETLTPWWWYKAATCAIEWAFVPPTGTLQAALEDVQEAWDDSSLGQVTTALIEAGEGLATGWTASCSGGISENVGLESGEPLVDGLDMPCTPPFSWWSTVPRAIITVGILGIVFFGVWRQIDRAIKAGD